MNNILIIVLPICGVLAGIVSICYGIKRNINNPTQFKLKHLILKTPLREQSGTQLIIEGIIALIGGFYLFYVFNT